MVNPLDNPTVARAMGRFHKKSAQLRAKKFKPPVPGTCRICGCTEDRACNGGCIWIDAERTLCSSCGDTIDAHGTHLRPAIAADICRQWESDSAAQTDGEIANGKIRMRWHAIKTGIRFVVFIKRTQDDAEFESHIASVLARVFIRAFLLGHGGYLTSGLSEPLTQAYAFTSARDLFELPKNSKK